MAIFQRRISPAKECGRQPQAPKSTRTLSDSPQLQHVGSRSSLLTMMGSSTEQDIQPLPPPLKRKKHHTRCCSFKCLFLGLGLFISCSFTTSIVFFLALDELMNMDAPQPQHMLLRAPPNKNAAASTVALEERALPVVIGVLELIDEWFGGFFFDKYDRKVGSKNAKKHPPNCQIKVINVQKYTKNETIVPFVYMVHKRVEHLQAALDSLRASDFPRGTVPVIISHDGRVPEMVEYVESLKTEGYFQIVQLFHPYSCFDHPSTFPGDDPKLNEDYAGDRYGKPRTSALTCGKHHFTWMLQKAFQLDFGDVSVDHFFFLKEDYIVAPTVYSTIMEGLNAAEQFQNLTDEEGILGIGLAVSTAHQQQTSFWDQTSYNFAPFSTGPMTLDREKFKRLRKHAVDFCSVDDYNWERSLSHLIQKGYLPHTMLYPGVDQAHHVGLEDDGMHSGVALRPTAVQQRRAALRMQQKKSFDDTFAGETICFREKIKPLNQTTLFGGWGHPTDQEHCRKILQTTSSKPELIHLRAGPKAGVKDGPIVSQKVSMDVTKRLSVGNAKDVRRSNAVKRPPGAERVVSQNRKCNQGLHTITVHDYTMDNTVVPIVYMIHDRVDYFRKAMQSLRDSDFPHATVPVIISHDGHVPEMVEYVDSLKSEGYFNIIQIFHPFSCYDHPDSFPGDDKSLNEGYAGDTYGHPRTASVTCCKHHFTWLLNTVFAMKFGDQTVDHFFFMEEDYLVAPTIYLTIVQGLNAMEQFKNDSNGGFLGLGFAAGKLQKPAFFLTDAFNMAPFTTGPMTLSRDVFGILREASPEYCLVDEYNWDWSMVYTAMRGGLPFTMLYPGTAQVLHIGTKGGMHNYLITTKERRRIGDAQSFDSRFESNGVCKRNNFVAIPHKKVNGGWRHEMDLLHCMDLFVNRTSAVELAVNDALKQPVSSPNKQKNTSSQSSQIGQCLSIKNITAEKYTMSDTVVPFVYMVHDRAHYLKAAMESLSLSDFPNATVPVIISHDGKVPEVVDYVNSLKEEGGFRVIQLFHPFACYDHPNDFPGNDTGLNEGYEGDSYGNPRTWSVTCAKHHFTWLLTTVFAMDFGDGVVDNFLFMEEDYVVAPTVYSTIIRGLNAMDQFSNLTSSGFLGVGLVAGKMQKVSRFRTTSFNAAAFTTGPMTLSRDVFLKLQASPSDYCLVDEYNWDWSIVHTAYLGHLPHTMIFPGKQQAMHIGVEGGMHNELLSAQDRRKALAKDPFDLKFAGTDFCDLGAIPMIQHSKGFGGWGHAKDMSHCLSFFSNNTAQIKALVRGVLERNHEAKEAVAPGTRTAQKNNPHLPQKVKSVLPQEVKPGLPEITVRDFSVNQTVVPFVYMVFKRVEYLQEAMESLRASDFPNSKVPVIISHDGHIQEVVEFVNLLKEEGYFIVIQIFHPYACYDHPNDFPGNDTCLNEGYQGDSYGNLRSWSITCCKHHFTWLMTAVFAMDFGEQVVDNFLFIEEDYIVAPTVYSTIITGLNAMQQFHDQASTDFLGVGLIGEKMQKAAKFDRGAFNAAAFTTGPMTLSREIFYKLQTHAAQYCLVDDYNWDWSIVHTAQVGSLPHVMVYPGVPQAKHIGTAGGMHNYLLSAKDRRNADQKQAFNIHFAGTTFNKRGNVPAVSLRKVNGGWGHKKDMSHCMDVLSKKTKEEIESLVYDAHQDIAMTQETNRNKKSAAQSGTTAKSGTTTNKCAALHEISLQDFSAQKTIVPFVFMVGDQLADFKKTIATLRASDFPRETVPVIISHDGHVSEMIEYVNQLKEEDYFQVVQLFHPYSCYDHPDGFPGNDPALNIGYEGDTYGNPRAWDATCRKHHFAWLAKTVFGMDFGEHEVDDIMFFDVEYFVASNVYQTIVQGLNAIKQLHAETGTKFLGIGLAAREPQQNFIKNVEAFNVAPFTSGPITMNRQIFALLLEHASDYCEFDEYNWDWSVVYAASRGHVPHSMLYPGQPRVQLIDEGSNKRKLDSYAFKGEFQAKQFCSAVVGPVEHGKGFGGWGHPEDQKHCMRLWE